MEKGFNIVETKDVNSVTKIQIWESGKKLERKIVSLKDLLDDPEIVSIINNNIQPVDNTSLLNSISDMINDINGRLNQLQLELQALQNNSIEFEVEN